MLGVSRFVVRPLTRFCRSERRECAGLPCKPVSRRSEGSPSGDAHHQGSSRSDRGDVAGVAKATHPIANGANRKSHLLGNGRLALPNHAGLAMRVQEEIDQEAKRRAKSPEMLAGGISDEAPPDRGPPGFRGVSH
jgi:hypothetical protein